jgi:hypothetical protein
MYFLPEKLLLSSRIYIPGVYPGSWIPDGFFLSLIPEVNKALDPGS